MLHKLNPGAEKYEGEATKLYRLIDSLTKEQMQVIVSTSAHIDRPAFNYIANTLQTIFETENESPLSNINVAKQRLVNMALQFAKASEKTLTKVETTENKVVEKLRLTTAELYVGMATELSQIINLLP